MKRKNLKSDNKVFEAMLKEACKDAAEEMFAAQQWFDQDSLQLSLEGNAKYMGFKAIIDVCYLRIYINSVQTEEFLCLNLISAKGTV